MEARDPSAAGGLLDRLDARACPVCGATDDSHEIYPERVDPARLGRMSYSSRKEPEFMSLRMVACPGCDLLYTPRVPSNAFLHSAYAQTGYDSSEEAGHAASSYAEALAERLCELPDRASVLEVGTGNGALLGHLQRLGFGEVLGIEPSQDAAAAAPPGLRPLIRVEAFDPARLPQGHFSLVIANQTLEHVRDPGELLAAARSLLKPGGAVMIVSHNWRHWLMRLLGAKSPIIDIEHLQVFSPASLEAALARAGFARIRIASFGNRYPASYWTRLLPVPPRLKQPLLAWLAGGGRRLGQCAVRAHVGNMIAWAHVDGSRPLPIRVSSSRSS